LATVNVLAMAAIVNKTTGSTISFQAPSVTLNNGILTLRMMSSTPDSGEHCTDVDDDPFCPVCRVGGSGGVVREPPLRLRRHQCSANR
jgi:hypothetical protein